MKVKKSIANRIMISVVIVIIAIYIFFVGGLDYTNIFNQLSVVSIILFCTIIFLNPLGLSSPFSVFIIVLFIYNCGQVWLNLLGIPIIKGNYTIDRYSDELLAQSLLFFILMISSINIFYLFNINSLKIYSKNNYRKKVKIKKILFIFISVLSACIIYDYNQYKIASTFGYATALYARSNNELLYMFNCIFPFIIFYMIRLDMHMKYKVIIGIIGVARYIGTMIFIGYRMQAVSFILTMIVLLSGVVKKEERKKINLFFIIGIVSIGFISVVAANLRRGLDYIGVLDSFYLLLQELGGTFTDLPIIIRDIDEIGVVYGLTYICGFLYIIPFIGHIIPEMSKYVNLSSILYTRIKIYGESSLGGSMIAEFFYNFKWLAIIIMGYIIGKLLAKISKNLYENKSFNIYKTSILIYIFYILLLFIRGNIGEITIYIRCVVYLYLFYIMWYKRQRG